MLTEQWVLGSSPGLFGHTRSGAKTCAEAQFVSNPSFAPSHHRAILDPLTIPGFSPLAMVPSSMPD